MKKRAPPAGRRAVNLPARPLRMYLVPCSCGVSFAVAADYDRQGSDWNRYLTCPGCGKRHDPRNRLLEIAYQAEGYWKVDRC